MAIVAGLIESPEEPIGSPFLTLEIKGDGTGFIVDAELRGYLDDSILGENLKARIEPDGTQWRLIAVGRQTICARGEARGKPAPPLPLVAWPPHWGFRPPSMNVPRFPWYAGSSWRGFVTPDPRRTPSSLEHG